MGLVEGTTRLAEELALFQASASAKRIAKKSAEISDNTAKIETQLDAIQHHLQQQAEREYQRMNRNDIEARLRENLFQLEERVARIRTFFDSAPTAAVHALNVLSRSIERSGVNSDQFDQFVDKDRVRQFRNTILEALKEANERISQADRDRAHRIDLRMDAIDEMKNILKLRELHAERNDLENYLRRVNASDTSKTMRLTLLILSGILIATILGAIVGIPLLLGTLLLLPKAVPEQKCVARIIFLRQLKLEDQLAAVTNGKYARADSPLLVRTISEQEELVHKAALYDRYGRLIEPPLLD